MGNMDIKKLEKILADQNQPAFRLNQILKAVYQEGVGSFSEISVLPKELRISLDQELSILSFKLGIVQESSDGQSAKALFRLSDGLTIESVLMSPLPRKWSACVSTQVGCPMGCRFCATGQMGFKRNLTAEEIADQVLFWRQYLKKFRNSKLEIRNYDVSSVVYMGMGEPFLNWENVAGSLKMLTDKNLFGFGSRSISISTSGVTEGILRLTDEFPQVNLAISLHFADDQKRSVFMPVNKKDNLDKLRKSLRKYLRNTNRQLFVEYILLEGINDSRNDAVALADYLKSIGKLQLLHVNLIRYNTTSAELKPSLPTIAQKFKHTLLANRIQSTIRKSLGDEIKGACGQLTGK